MNIFSRFKSGTRAFFASGGNQLVTGMTLEQLIEQLKAGQRTDAGVDVSAESSMRCGAVYSCVRVLAETESMLPLFVYRWTANGDREQARDHPLWDVLNHRPNPWQTAFEFREMLMGHLVLRGNAYAFIVRNILTGAVQSLIPLKPSAVKPRQLADLSIVYDYTPPNGGSVTYTQTQVLHIRGMSDDGVVGVTPITAYRNAVGLALAAERLQSKAFSNGAKFTGFLKSKDALKPEAIRNLRESFADLHNGDNAFKTPVLEQNLDWVSTGMPLDDAQLLETRKFQKTEIAGIYRVPPHMIGDVQVAKGWSTLEQQSSEFVTFCMMPWFERWEQAIRRDLMTPTEQKTYSVEHNVDALLRGDTTARYAAYNTGIMSGWLSRNEVRQKENLNHVDGLDEYLSPMNMNQGAKTGDTNGQQKTS